jgi:hypothetical protein
LVQTIVRPATAGLLDLPNSSFPRGGTKKNFFWGRKGKESFYFPNGFLKAGN